MKFDKLGFYDKKIFCLCCCSSQRDMVKTYGIGHRLLEKVGIIEVCIVIELFYLTADNVPYDSGNYLAKITM